LVWTAVKEDEVGELAKDQYVQDVRRKDHG
jgi:hypothetical protein